MVETTYLIRFLKYFYSLKDLDNTVEVQGQHVQLRAYVATCTNQIETHTGANEFNGKAELNTHV